MQQKRIEGDTDPDPDPEAGPGRFRRGLTAAGSMLGGAYSKAKGSSLIKLLGLGVLIFAFNKYRDEIITAMASILEYFNDVYDVFKSEGLGAAFDKIVDDFKNIFFPKIKEMSMSLLDFLWGAIKGATVEWMFGAKGDKRVTQELRRKSEAEPGFSQSITDLGQDKASVKGGIYMNEGVFQTTTAISGDLTKGKKNSLDNYLNETLMSMQQVTKQTEGRIQWFGLPNLDQLLSKKDLSGVSVQDVKVAAATPIIDGVISTMEDLKDWKIMQSAGITKGMDAENSKQIIANLAEMTEITRKLNEFEQGKSLGDKAMTFFGFDGTEYTSESAKARIEELKLINRDELGQLNQTEISRLTGATTTFTTPDDTKPKEEVKKLSGRFADMEKQFKQRYLPDGTLARPLTLADQKTITNVNAGTVNNLPMSSGKTSWTAMLYANAGTVYKQSN